jgi:hypothetical protein
MMKLPKILTLTLLFVAMSLVSVNGYAAGKSAGKVDICHIPPGNPSNARTINVSKSAVPAHMAHGDSMGAYPDGGIGNVFTVCDDRTGETGNMVSLNMMGADGRGCDLCYCLGGWCTEFF